MATNHFGPFLLTLLLMDLLKKSAPSRIVNVSSAAHTFAKQGIDFDNLRGEKPLSTMDKYAISKLANVLFTRELASRLKDTATKHFGLTISVKKTEVIFQLTKANINIKIDWCVNVYCVHPGMVDTEIARYGHPIFRGLLRLLSVFLKTPAEGAQTSIYVSVSEEVEAESGKYYMDCGLAEHRVSAQAKDLQLASRLWLVSAQFTGVPADI